MLKQAKYENALRDCWLDMLKNYPDLYDIADYVEACNQAGMLVF